MSQEFELQKFVDKTKEVVSEAEKWKKVVEELEKENKELKSQQQK